MLKNQEKTKELEACKFKAINLNDESFGILPVMGPHSVFYSKFGYYICESHNYVHVCTDGSDCVFEERDGMSKICKITGRELDTGNIVESPQSQMVSKFYDENSSKKYKLPSSDSQVKTSSFYCASPMKKELQEDTFFFEKKEPAYDYYYIDVLRRPQSYKNFVIIDKGMLNHQVFTDINYEERYKFYIEISRAFGIRTNLRARNTELLDALDMALVFISDKENGVNRFSTNGLRNIDGLKKFFYNQLLNLVLD